jgi:O-antigen ligase
MSHRTKDALPLRHDFAFGSLAGLCATLGVFFVARFVVTGEHSWLVALVLGGGALLGTVALCGPSRIALTLFIALMIAAHQFRSPMVLPLGPFEVHPRELLLAFLLAHLAAQILLTRADLRVEITHYWVFLYFSFFCIIFALGLLRIEDSSLAVAEMRNPLFLLSFFALAACVHSEAELWYYLRLVLGISVVIAVAGCAFFCYALLSGNIVNVQNWLGEYVPRLVGPLRIQSVRPSGHHFFEVCSVVLLSLIFARDVALRYRLLFLILIGLFGFAMAITMMRTAWLALACALGVLGVLHLPREARIITGMLGAAGVLGGVVAFGANAYDELLGLLPALEVSLRARVIEMQGAFEAFLRHPFFGAGMGSTFVGLGYVSSKTIRAAATAEFQTVHNVWMYFLFKGGMAGLILVLLGLGGIAGRGYALLDELARPRDRALLRGLLAAFVGQLIASLAMPRLTYASGHVFVAMIAAAIVVMARYSAKKNSGAA